MKFSDIEQSSWTDLKPYLDTCLLPITGLTGSEEPWEVAAALERLRDVMDWVELPFKGRVVTYPAVHFLVDLSLIKEEINRICDQLKRTGFKYVIVITAETQLTEVTFESADLFICKHADEGDLKEHAQVTSALIQEMWKVKFE
jgi:23S rRNA (pseudouridine1915-N3)-methyltransferase